jgi:DNA-binding transcriptional ArsR family regulator
MTLDSAFAALADPTRRALLERLETGEHTLTDLASPLPMSLMAVHKKGRSRHVRLRREGLEHVADWLQNTETRWNDAFDRLAEVLKEEQSS